MKVVRVVDLSHRVDERTQVFPGDPHPSFEPATTIAADGVNVLHVHLGSHSGTHVDAPYHFIEDGKRLDELDPGLFVGPAVILDVRGRGPRGRITAEDLRSYKTDLAPGNIAVLYTGWDRYYGTDWYYEHPFLDHRAAQLILDSGVTTVAVDALNVDETPVDGVSTQGFPVHRLICGSGGIIAENLTNLAAIDFPDPVLSLLPVKLGGADGAPVRAVALEFLG